MEKFANYMQNFDVDKDNFVIFVYNLDIKFCNFIADIQNHFFQHPKKLNPPTTIIFCDKEMIKSHC